MYQTHYRPTYARKARSAKTDQPAVIYSAETVWGAAACAHRINGGYYKTPEFNEDGTKIVRPCNKDIVKIALADQTMITTADREMGSGAKNFIAQQLTLKTLKNNLGDFDQTMTGIVGQEEFTNHNRFEIAVIASQIRAYEQSVKDLANADRVDRSKGHLAEVGGKVQARVEITKVVYSQNYGVYFLSGITDTNQAVFFSYRERLNIGACVDIKGTVKAHRPDATQLSRVRVG